MHITARVHAPIDALFCDICGSYNAQVAATTKFNLRKMIFVSEIIVAEFLGENERRSAMLDEEHDTQEQRKAGEKGKDEYLLPHLV